MGNTIVESTMRDFRFAPTDIKAKLGTTTLLDLSYYYCTPPLHSSCTNNNGNVQAQTITRGSQTWTQAYGYTNLNQLNCANETPSATAITRGTGSPNWSALFGFATDGNLWLGTTVGLPPPTSETPQAATAYLANNRISGWYYDCAGNVTGIPVSPGSSPACGTTLSGSMVRTALYDAESRTTSETSSNAVTTTYSYDGDGHRISKSVGGAAPTIYVYDPAGQMTAEYGTPTDGTIAGTYYLTADSLGSSRLRTDSAGNVKSCYDYLPFGGELTSGIDGRSTSCFASPPGNFNIKFTGKEWDYESSLDYFGARYFSPAQGRFTSPDEPFNDQEPSDPQSWNLYSYVRNNPLRNVDPSGQDCITATNQTDKSVTVTVASGNCSGNATNQTDVAGTVNMSSLSYNGTSIGFSYTSDDPNTTFGTGTVNLGPAPSDALSASAQHVLGQAGAMASDGSVFRGGALWIGQFLAMLDGAGGPREEFEPAEGTAGKSATSAGSMGRTSPETLTEQLAMEQVKAKPAGVPLKNTIMKDSRWPASQGWVKMEQKVNGVTVHYVRNTITGAVDDFKFK